jgi:hypothetical protein
MRNTGSTSGWKNATRNDDRQRENREARTQEVNDSAHPNRISMADLRRMQSR